MYMLAFHRIALEFATAYAHITNKAIHITSAVVSYRLCENHSELGLGPIRVK